MSDPLPNLQTLQLPVLRSDDATDDGKTLSSALWILAMVAQQPNHKLKRARLKTLCDLPDRVLCLGLDYLRRTDFVKLVAQNDEQGRMVDNIYCFSLDRQASAFPSRAGPEFFGK